MEQRCHLSMVWLTWLGLPLLAIVVGLRVGAAVGLATLGIGIVAQTLYVRWFPHLSRWMGYGSVADTPADAASFVAPLPRVTLYTANVCPFCPILRRRLTELQRQTPFELEEVDVTFRPEIVRAKGLHSVPVLEANGHLLVGNRTSSEIMEFLRATSGGQAPADAPRDIRRTRNL
jgi:glutaredoxin